MCRSGHHPMLDGKVQDNTVGEKGWPLDRRHGYTERDGVAWEYGKTLWGGGGVRVANWFNVGY